jgi:broad specificity phosphatase PhoE
MQGQWHSSLSANGRLHADVNGRWLKTLCIEHVWASPLGRVKETAEIIGTHMPMSPVWDDRLKEWSSGDWSGMLYADIGVERPEEWAAWVADQYKYRPPNGENFEDLEIRADSFLSETAPHPARTVAVLAHGFIIRVIVSRMAKLSQEDVLSIKQANDVVIRVRETPDGVIVDHFIAGKGPLEGLPRGEQGAA